jgi:hypothetical protein
MIRFKQIEFFDHTGYAVGHWRHARGSGGRYHGAWVSAGRRGPDGGGGMGTMDEISKITVPALIVIQDAPLEARRANEEAAKVLKGGKLIHMDGTGHTFTTVRRSARWRC